MATIKSFRDLLAWQKAMDLVEHVYGVTKPFPSDERFGLTAQLRRCAVSLPSNIAEGRSRRTSRDFLNFLSIADGSLAELETQIELARRLKYVDDPVAKSVQEAAQEVGRLINGLANSIRRRL
jgi:four helix bundle protein